MSIQQQAIRRVLLALIALLLLLSVGTAGYRWLEGMAPIDAVYMTVITISTVGFSEVKPLSAGGRIFTLALIVGGGSLAAFTLSAVADILLSGEWRAHLKHRRQHQMLKQLSNHFLVCGYGRVGREVVHELQAEGLPYVVIDSNPEKTAHVLDAGQPALEGNAADESILKKAGIHRARGLVAAVNSDAENVFIVLTARSLRPDLIIVARANFEASESKLLRAGANRVLSPSRIAGRRMVTMLVRPDVDDFLDEVAQASGLELLLEQVVLTPSSPLVGQTLGQARLRSQYGVTVLAYKALDGQLNSQPSANALLQASMSIIVIGTRQQLQALEQLAQGASPHVSPRSSLTK